MKNNVRNVFSVLLNIFLNKSNFNKFLILFLVGFVSRILVGYFSSVNFYLDFLSPVFLLYYICVSVFIILVHEFVNYFNFILSFSFINEICTSIIYIIGFTVRILVSMNTRIFSYKLEDIKISSMIKGAKHLFSRDKATLDINQSYTYSKNYNRTKIIDSKSIKESSNILDKNGGEYTKPLPKHGHRERSLA